MIYIKVKHRPDAGWSNPANANREIEGTLVERKPSHIEGVDWLTIDDGKSTVDIWYFGKYDRTERINICVRSDIVEILEMKDVDVVS